MSMKKRFWVFIPAAAIVLGIWFYFHRGAAVHYAAAKVTRGNIANTVEATGTLNPVGNTTVDSTGTITGGVTVGAQVNGRIMKVNVGFGSRVKKGEVLAEIDPTPYQSDVNSAQADLWNAQAAVLSAQANHAKSLAGVSNVAAQSAKDRANLVNAKKTYDRYKILIQKNYIAQADMDAAAAAYDAAAAQMNADRALIRSAQNDAQSAQKQADAASAAAQGKKAALRKALINLSYTKILSPVNGLVIASNTAAGQMVVSSFQSPNLFVIAKSLDTMQIDTLVDEADVPKIRPGQTARFNIDAYPAETFAGKVEQVRNNPITQQNVVNYDVIVYVANPQRKFLPGMTANVNFIVAQRRNVLEIPNRALLFVPPSAGKKVLMAPPSSGKPSRPGAQTPSGVWVLAKGKLEPRQVSLGITDGSMTEVTSGLSEGEEVVTGTTERKAKANPFATF